tara:strand:+ start:40 stop:441 length:402 start_codon:yes stop_codon:yes gene_type:complete
MPGISPKLPLSLDPVDGYRLNKNLKQVIQQNLKMLVLTAPGERIMIPEFGVGLRNYLFRNATNHTFMEIENRIMQQASYYMPGININKVEFRTERRDEASMVIEGTSPTNYLQIRIIYDVPSLFISNALTINL